ncbi:minor tail protein [Gordonia phage Catfish]|uniref:Minor tail protein n=1 Tax=Gordonia phage Catfish TaxID=2301538 RepID=A0A385D0J0_9CAUD|nr:minor tail protein [Gordonia phage Catfish]AXQ51863.1 minor tail protein [Gordonia phage Catfish]
MMTTPNYDDDGAVWDDLAIQLVANFVDLEDYPATGSLLVEVIGNKGALQLPRGRRGPQGVPGRAAAPFESVRAVSSSSALPSNPTDGQKRTAYVASDTGKMWAWDADANAFAEVGLFRGEKGDQGPAVRIVAGNIAASAPGGDPAFALEQIAPDTYALHVTLPRGEEGPEGGEGPPGPSAAIATAADYNSEAGTPAPGSVLRMGQLGMWEPAPYYQEVGPFSPDTYTEHTGAVGTTAPQRTVASVAIPAQPFPWRPRAFAGCHVAGPVDGSMSLEVRLGAENGALVARGIEYDNNDKYCTTIPVTDTANSVVPAHTATTLFLIAKRNSGLAPWKQRKEFASLQVWAVPVLDGMPMGAVASGSVLDGGEL